MALAVYNSASFVNAAGMAQISANSTVEVRRESDNGLASIFSDVNGSSALGNPMTADAEGQFTFYVASSPRGYKVTVTKGASVRVLRNVAIGTGSEFDMSDVLGALMTNPSIAAFLTALGLGTGSTPSFAQVAVAGDPGSALQVATKQYVDAAITGSDLKPSVLCATTANITLSGEQTLDGILTSASRVLVKNQSAPAQNGIYVSAAGAWSRALDMDNWLEVPGAFVMVERGSTLADTAWVSTADQGGTIGSTSITWVQFGVSGGISEPQVDVFTSSGTWTKRAGATKVSGILINAGQGGASGRRGAAGTARYGGGGGMCGDTAFFEISAALLGATEAVTVGVGGTGGAAVAVNDTNGNPGGQVTGGPTSFGTWAKTIPGDSLPGGGTNATGAGGGFLGIFNVSSSGNGTYGYASQGGNSDIAAVPQSFNSGGYAPGSGGAGGGIDAANVARAGGPGSNGAFGGKTANGGTGGVVGGAAATVGAANTANLSQGGGGGGGGAASITAAAGAGANGGAPGGGGGGGGASLNGNNSGAGGNGANGIVIIIQT